MLERQFNVLVESTSLYTPGIVPGNDRLVIRPLPSNSVRRHGCESFRRRLSSLAAEKSIYVTPCAGIRWKPTASEFHLRTATEILDCIAALRSLFSKTSALGPLA